MTTSTGVSEVRRIYIEHSTLPEWDGSGFPASAFTIGDNFDSGDGRFAFNVDFRTADGPDTDLSLIHI